MASAAAAAATADDASNAITGAYNAPGVALPTHGAILANRAILEQLHQARIVIHPFSETQLSIASYDVRLGEYYFRASSNADVLVPYSKQSIVRTWGEPQEAAVLTSAELSKYGLEMTSVQGQRGFLIQPGETVLAHTIEYIGAYAPFTSLMKARSSMARCGIAICKCAGYGDPGYVNRWTMEITNTMKTHPVLMLVGKRVAQIVFMNTTGPVGPSYGQDPTRNKYQAHYIPADVIKNWTPYQMLPQCWRELNDAPQPHARLPQILYGVSVAPVSMHREPPRPATPAAAAQPVPPGQSAPPPPLTAPPGTFAATRTDPNAPPRPLPPELQPVKVARGAAAAGGAAPPASALRYDPDDV